MTPTSEPKLAAPGAGLPGIELLIGRTMFRLKRRKGNRQAFLTEFRREQGQIHALVESCQKSRRGEMVLIDRIRGLEDSSRNWSVWMTLEHLRITNEAFRHFVMELSEGRVPDQVVRTADVKPDPLASEGVEEAFGSSCESFLKDAAAAPELRSEARLAHPWFGPLDAYGWLALASTHMRIHRGQIEAILHAMSK